MMVEKCTAKCHSASEVVNNCKISQSTVVTGGITRQVSLATSQIACLTALHKVSHNHANSHGLEHLLES